MHKLLGSLMYCGSVVALMTASAVPGLAQDNGAAEETESVTVSASRISIQGYEAPTPVTVIGVEQLAARRAHEHIGDSIASCPSSSAESPNNGTRSGDLSQGDAASDVVNLRNLGIARTLVLFDGQRVVSSNIFGGVASIFHHSRRTGQARGCGDGRRLGGLGLRRRGRRGQPGPGQELSGVKGNFNDGDSAHVRHRDQDGDDGGYRNSRRPGSSDRAATIPGATTRSSRTRPTGSTTRTSCSRPDGGPPSSRRIRPGAYTQGGLITGGPLKGIQFVGPSSSTMRRRSISAPVEPRPALHRLLQQRPDGQHDPSPCPITRRLCSAMPAISSPTISRRRSS